MMRWERLSDYAIRSGDWFIAKFCLGDKCRYTVYHADKLVGIFNDPQKAKACAKTAEQERLVESSRNA